MSQPVLLLIAEVGLGLALLRWLLARGPLPAAAPDQDSEGADPPPRSGPFY